MPRQSAPSRSFVKAWLTRNREHRKPRYYCLHEDCKDSSGRPNIVFSRKADVLRHSKTVHEKYYRDCPKRYCARKGINGFTRDDHLVEHLRGYHRENIPQRQISHGGSSTARSALHDLDDFYVRSMCLQPAVPVTDGYGTRAYFENNADIIQGRANAPQIRQETPMPLEHEVTVEREATISSDGQGGSSDPVVGAISRSAWWG